MYLYIYIKQRNIYTQFSKEILYVKSIENQELPVGTELRDVRIKVCKTYFIPI